MTWLSSCSGSSSSSCSGPPARPDQSARRSAGPPGVLVVMRVDASQEGGAMVITGELDLAPRPLLAEHLSAVLRTGPRRLILDLAGTGFVDCGSARLIVSAARSLP